MNTRIQIRGRSTPNAVHNRGLLSFKKEKKKKPEHEGENKRTMKWTREQESYR